MTSNNTDRYGVWMNDGEGERYADEATGEIGFDLSTASAIALRVGGGYRKVGATASQTSGNASVVVNYSKPEMFSDFADRDGYVQLTRSAGRVFLVVDGRAVGSMADAEFARVKNLLAPTDEVIRMDYNECQATAMPRYDSIRQVATAHGITDDQVRESLKRSEYMP